MKNPILISVFALSLSAGVMAHDGPVNDAGCHFDDATSMMHCHNERARFANKGKDKKSPASNKQVSKSESDVTLDNSSPTFFYAQKSDFTRINGSVLFKVANVSNDDSAHVIVYEAYQDYELEHVARHLNAEGKIYFYLAEESGSKYAYLRDYKPVGDDYLPEELSQLVSMPVFAEFANGKISFAPAKDVAE